MKYEKPEITGLGSTIEAVQAHVIKEQPCRDNATVATCNAYEADE